jgi:hypothetical protein
VEIESRGLIYDATSRPAEERIAFFAGLCPLISGTVLAGFQVGSSKHGPGSTVRLCRSRDGGRTWKELPWRPETRLNGVPGSLAAAEMAETYPGHLLLFSTWFDRSNPERPLFDPDTEGLLHSRLLIAESVDDGETWGDWRELNTGELTGCAGTGPVIVWPSGLIAFPFESFKQFDDPEPARHGAWVLLSRDRGRTFSAPVLVARHPKDRLYYWDQRLCPAGPDGQFNSLIWTHERAAKRDRLVHFQSGDIENGAFYVPMETTIPGQIAAPAVLPDGRIVGFVVNRERPATMRLWVSAYDHGKTWSPSHVIYEHEETAKLTQGSTDIDFAQYWEDMGRWSFGHPAIRLLPHEDVLLLAWYAGTPEAMSIHWARVRFERLYS